MSKSNTTDPELEQILDILNRYHIAERNADSGTVVSLKPYAQEIAHWAAKQELRGRIDELNKWRTMVQRLSEYVDSPASLVEYDERIAGLQQELDYESLQ